MYFEVKHDSFNAYLCISVYTVSGNIARIAAILPELQQYCKHYGNTNLHAKSSIASTLQRYCRNVAAILLQYCQKLLLQYCGRLVFQ